MDDYFLSPISSHIQAQKNICWQDITSLYSLIFVSLKTNDIHVFFSLVFLFYFSCECNFNKNEVFGSVNNKITFPVRQKLYISLFNIAFFFTLDFTCECNFNINEVYGAVNNEITGSCTTNTCGDGHTFCLNEGECVEMGDGTSWCHCPEGVTGEFCETGKLLILVVRSFFLLSLYAFVNDLVFLKNMQINSF